MRVIVPPYPVSGILRVPASKSHTIRRLLIAALAQSRTDEVSSIDYPLDSLDAQSCVAVCRALGASIIEERSADAACSNPPDVEGRRLVRYIARGRGKVSDTMPHHESPAVEKVSDTVPHESLAAKKVSDTMPHESLAIEKVSDTIPRAPLDVGNSGTTLFLALAVAALDSVPITFTGDAQIRARSAAPLLSALEGLGVTVKSTGNGCAPITVQGPLRGGHVSLSCPTSQYLSALLLAAPLADEEVITEIDVPLLNEKPYIELTLSYLNAQGIVYEKAPDFSYFRLPGGQSYKPMNGPVPADFSSAAFPACIAAVTGGPLTLLGLDPHDVQGDKFMFEMLARMGCEVDWTQEGVTVSRNGTLRGGIFDLNDTPDLLPVMAVAACFAEGETALVNVAHARIKETDRIAVMAHELGKLGIHCDEKPDALIIHGGVVHGGAVDGHGDHRVVMALAVAALGATGPVEITGAEAADVTYPGFLAICGAENR